MLSRKFVPIAIILLLTTALMSAPLFARPMSNSMSVNDTEKRLDTAASVLSDILGAPDKGIPQDLLRTLAAVSRKAPS